MTPRHTAKAVREPAAPRAPEALEMHEISDLLSSVLFDNADGIVIIDAEGYVRLVNPAAERLLGQMSGSLVGTQFGFPVSTVIATEIDLVGRSRRIAEMRVANTSLNGEPLYVATLRDVTSRKEAEESLRNFVSMASHEFRTPITSISGFATTIRDQWDVLDDEAKLRFLDVIDRQANRLARLATDLLSLSRIDAGGSHSAVRTNVAKVTRLAIEVVGEPIGVVDIDMPDDLEVLVDPDHLEEILINYLANALKYGRPPIAVIARAVGGAVEIKVTDEGPGVPVDFRAKLFQRFARERSTARDVSGSGLGLSIVDALASRNNGTAWYRPLQPEGSVFGVTLPGWTSRPH